MKKVLVVMIIMLVLSGCAPVVSNPVNTIPTTVKTSIVPTKRTESPSDTEARLVNQTWVSPAEINIGNYYAGARAEWKIKVHNGNDAIPQYESYRVGTEPNETIAPIKIKLPLAGNDFSKVGIISDNPSETLIAAGYNPSTKEVTIRGFLPSTTRIITISYIAWTEFSVGYLSPSKTKEGYSSPPVEAQDWIIIADNSPVLAPKETREILVTLEIPKGVIVDTKKWEFQIVVMEQGQGNIQLEYSTRWFVKMR